MHGYTAVVRELRDSEGGGFLAEFPDLPGCVADGATREEALKNLDDAAEEWIAAAKRLGRTIPEPNTAEYSGKWVQRVPKSLHRRLASEAKREGVSLNALTSTILAEGVGKRRVA